jgi:hypothetical protein
MQDASGSTRIAAFGLQSVELGWEAADRWCKASTPQRPLLGVQFARTYFRFGSQSRERCRRAPAMGRQAAVELAPGATST